MIRHQEFESTQIKNRTKTKERARSLAEKRARKVKEIVTLCKCDVATGFIASSLIQIWFYFWDISREAYDAWMQIGCPLRRPVEKQEILDVCSRNSVCSSVRTFKTNAEATSTNQPNQVATSSKGESSILKQSCKGHSWLHDSFEPVNILWPISGIDFDRL